VTEAEWLACAEPEKKLLALPRSADSLRRRRLLACARARHVWERLPAQWRAAVEMGERRASQQVKEREMVAARPGNPTSEAEWVANWAISPADILRQRYFGLTTSSCARAIAKSQDSDSPPVLAAIAMQAKLIQDIYGNPFRPVAIDRTWLTPVLLALAQAAYDAPDLPSGHLDATRLAVLANIHDHLRGPGPHVRGCWVLDLLLGKE
jgi:hypothetical protein